MRLRSAVLAVALSAAMLTACGPFGGSPTPAPPTINFVGNSTCATDGAAPYDPSPPNTNGTPVGQAIDEMPHTHVQVGTKVTYNHDPPTSGCHYSVGASATQQGAPIVGGGFFDQPIDPEYWVHNLEHGYIVVLYNCPSGCDSDKQKLRDWHNGLPPEDGFPYAKVVIVPETTMKVKFACVSWDWYLGMNSLDISQVNAFYENHKGQSPEGMVG